MVEGMGVSFSFRRSCIRRWFSLALQFRPHHSALRKTALGDRAKNGWYLHLLSTDPAYQRRGLATALMKSAEDKVCAVLITGCMPSHVL
jgi:GNAT superfamily N-acetyltransferase